MQGQNVQCNKPRRSASCLASSVDPKFQSHTVNPAASIFSNEDKIQTFRPRYDAETYCAVGNLR